MTIKINVLHELEAGCRVLLNPKHSVELIDKTLESLLTTRLTVLLQPQEAQDIVATPLFIVLERLIDDLAAKRESGSEEFNLSSAVSVIEFKDLHQVNKAALASRGNESKTVWREMFEAGFKTLIITTAANNRREFWIKTSQTSASKALYLAEKTRGQLQFRDAKLGISAIADELQNLEIAEVTCLVGGNLRTVNVNSMESKALKEASVSCLLVRR